MMFTRTRKQNEKGFTLIELLVVVAIIGLLASVILASLSTAREKARDATRISDINQIQTALELYYGSCKSYPSAITTASDAECTGANVSDFIDPLPTDPEDGANYVYAIGGTAPYSDYCLGANLEDDAHPEANATSTTAYTACNTTVVTGWSGATYLNTDYIETP